MTSVYWIAHKDHTDIFSQGYVGVSNNVEKRWDYHKKKGENNHIRNAIKKYGWDNLVKKVVLIGEEDYCLGIENKLRPADKIGWNLVCGGGKPPSALGKKFYCSAETKQKMSLARLGGIPWNKGKQLNETQKQKLFNLPEYMKDKPHGRLGKSLSPESIEKMRQKKVGKKQPAELVEKRRQKLIGRKYEKIACPKCNMQISINMAKRYHFDNCKGLRPYKARVTIDGKRIFLGRFETKDLATQAEMQAYKNANKPYPIEFIKLKGLQQWQV
jgi:group I intron endonuclease